MHFSSLEHLFTDYTGHAFLLCVGWLLVSVRLVPCAPFKCSWTFLASTLSAGAADACFCTQLLQRWLGSIIQVNSVAQQALCSLAMSLVPKLELLCAKIVCKCLSTSSLPAAGSVYAACQEPLETRRVEMGGRVTFSFRYSIVISTPASIRRWCLMMGREARAIHSLACLVMLCVLPIFLTYQDC